MSESLAQVEEEKAQDRCGASDAYHCLIILPAYRRLVQEIHTLLQRLFRFCGGITAGGVLEDLVKRCSARDEVAKKAPASTATGGLHSIKDLHRLIQMVAASTQYLASKGRREVLVACLTFLVQCEWMIQHDSAEVIHPPGPDKMACFLPIVAFVCSELFSDVCVQVVLSNGVHAFKAH